jgi:hypothetical protein
MRGLSGPWAVTGPVGGDGACGGVVRVGVDLEGSEDGGVEELAGLVRFVQQAHIIRIAVALHSPSANGRRGIGRLRTEPRVRPGCRPADAVLAGGYRARASRVRAQCG